jgi:hypothetical protein
MGNPKRDDLAMVLDEIHPDMLRQFSSINCIQQITFHEMFPSTNVHEYSFFWAQIEKITT